jgi:EAL domain-containing protein (putative c-di-GMP-specific phosphodiesterase class I)
MVDFMKQVIPFGVLFCIDDFGTQYSSMEYLQRLPVHEVKIDKSFVLSALSDDASEKIVRSVIQLAHSLNLSVTAEGVENEQMLNFLRSWKCDQAQGFYFSQALSADEFEIYLTESESPSISA